MEDLEKITRVSQTLHFFVVEYLVKLNWIRSRKKIHFYIPECPI